MPPWLSTSVWRSSRLGNLLVDWEEQKQREKLESCTFDWLMSKTLENSSSNEAQHPFMPLGDAFTVTMTWLKPIIILINFYQSDMARMKMHCQKTSPWQGVGWGARQRITRMHPWKRAWWSPPVVEWPEKASQWDQVPGKEVCCQHHIGTLTYPKREFLQEMRHSTWIMSFKSWTGVQDNWNKEHAHISVTTRTSPHEFYHNVWPTKRRPVTSAHQFFQDPEPSSPWVRTPANTLHWPLLVLLACGWRTHFASLIEIVRVCVLDQFHYTKCMNWHIEHARLLFDLWITEHYLQENKTVQADRALQPEAHCPVSWFESRLVCLQVEHN